eukprot:m.64231 g.64231  ORF g.64231 m.64231 type:complete len:57 (-) comp11992_c1_seq1:2080-2250(-)
MPTVNANMNKQSVPFSFQSCKCKATQNTNIPIFIAPSWKVVDAWFFRLCFLLIVGL